MSLLSANDLAALRAALQDAVVRCSERCLYQSAKWAAELLTSIPEIHADNTNAAQDAARTLFAPNPDPEEARLEAREANKYLLAKSLFDCGEYDRCSTVFLPDSLLSNILESHPDRSGTSGSGGVPPARSTPKSPPRKNKGKERAWPSAVADTEPPKAIDSSLLPNISQKSLFLALYAKFVSGEKRKNEDTEMVLGPQDQGNVANKQLNVVSRLLAGWFDARTAPEGNVTGSQGWLEYLYGMVFAREKDEQQAMSWFIQSVHTCPMNWGCWLEMTSLISRVEELNAIARQLPQNIVSFMFHLHASLELYQQSPSLVSSVEQLLSIFPNSAFLLTCSALLSYHAKDLIAAEQAFSRLLALHPYRLDSLDHYSNILYVMNLRPKLAFLAHLCSSIDKFRPESCVVVGNYYSLLSMHEKAVQYFRRALTLDRSCLSAWTLMGHEYVELKNTHAAIESYRRAVDVNRRDYRAWYGLGQTYEMLEMHTYSLWYYKKAAGLRPWDGKMWQAVGSCLQRMGRDLDGIKALKRALLADAFFESGSFSENPFAGGQGAMGHMEPEILLQIALMYEHIGEEEEAKAYMELCIAQEDGSANADVFLGESVAIHNDSPVGSDDGREGRSRDRDNGGSGEGTGVTAATSAARKWLARYAMQHEDYSTANRLATELCQDGVEIEDAKALIREVRSRMDAMETGAGSGGPSHR